MIPITLLERLSTLPVTQGSFADVFHCTWNATHVALKELRIKSKAPKLDDIKLEAALCFQIKHPNIVAMFGMTKLEYKHMGLVMEWADQGSLRDNMEKMKKEDKIKVSLCICEGLAYIHSNIIAHWNLKPENVLLFHNKSTAKISNFGISKVFTRTEASGTPKYCAPELMGEEVQVFISLISIVKLNINFFRTSNIFLDL